MSFGFNVSAPQWAMAQPGNEAPVPYVAGEAVVPIGAPRSELKIIEKFAKVIELPDNIVRVDGFDPQVLNVTALTPKQLRVQALAPGITTLVVVDRNQSVFQLDVFVTGDVRHLQAYINKFFPHDSVEAVAVRENVVLRGWVTQPEHINQLVEVAKQFFPDVLNQMTVGGGQEVKLKVKVLEVQRAKLRQMGFNFIYRTDNAYLASTIGALNPIAALTTGFNTAPTVTPSATSLTNSNLLFGISGSNSDFNGFLEALKQEALLKVRAEPEIVVTNGRPATLLSGGEFPILVPQSLGTVTVEWREFGVRMEGVATVLGGGRVRLELQPEVSERDFTNAVTLSGTTVPGLTSRRVNTQVNMRFGETFVIAGLLFTQRTGRTIKTPILGELPYVGAAFRRESFNESETEMVIMVTPELVAAVPAEMMPPGGPGMFTDIPTDREFYLDGILEVPKYGDRCSSCGNSFQGGYGHHQCQNCRHHHIVPPSASPIPSGSRQIIMPAGPAPTPAASGEIMIKEPLPVPSTPSASSLPPADLPADGPALNQTSQNKTSQGKPAGTKSADTTAFKWPRGGLPNWANQFQPKGEKESSSRQVRFDAADPAGTESNTASTADYERPRGLIVPDSNGGSR